MKLLFVYALLLFTSISSAQTFYIQSGGGLTNDEAFDISTDASGNNYITGYFSSDAAFGNDTLHSSGVTDIFIAKTDLAGNYLWIKKAGGPQGDRGLSIRADAAGNCVITGFFSGTADFGGVTLTAQGNTDIFVAKYSSAGSLLWAQQAGGADNDVGNAVTLDASGNVLVTGQFTGAAAFGTQTLTSAIDTSGNYSVDVFTARYNASGSLQWVRQGSAPFTDRGLDIGADGSGNVYVTGQFSDTITFGQVHTNNQFNSVFLVKYDAQGNEVWFRKCGGGIRNIAYGLAVDGPGNIFLCGDFAGTMIIFGNTNASLSHLYSNRIFLLKYDPDGTLLRADADGSDADVSARNLVLDDSCNAYVVGMFKCKMSDYADEYGQGTFNSIGTWDVFVSKYDSALNRQWMRNCGSQQMDYGSGITVGADHQPVISGSFQSRIIFPYSHGLVNHYIPPPGTSNAVYSPPGQSYCGDSLYHKFVQMKSRGASDLFIGKPFDLNRSPLDYYKRFSPGCTKEYVGVCASKNFVDYSCTGDTVNACDSTWIYAISNTSSIDGFGSTLGGSSPGPLFTYLWSTGQTDRRIRATTTGWYSVQLRSADTCFTSNDSIFVNLHQSPPKACISDSKGINFLSTSPDPISLCFPDSVRLCASCVNPGDTLTWYGLPLSTHDTCIDIFQSGWYYVKITTQWGCVSYDSILVNIIVPSPKIPALYINCLLNDTMKVCAGQCCRSYIYDSLNDPLASNPCGIPILDTLLTFCDFVPHLPFHPNGGLPACVMDLCPSVQDTGWHEFNCTFILIQCDTDTFTVYKRFYIEVTENPGSIYVTGPSFVCPGSTVELVAHGGLYYDYWTQVPAAGGILNLSDLRDTVIVNQQGWYVVHGFFDTLGCTFEDTGRIFIRRPPQPIISPDPLNALICPDDSVLLTVNIPDGPYDWQGPGGTVGEDSLAVYVDIPGFYYCTVIDSATQCVIASNTIEVRQYATPYIYITPQTILCTGGSVQLQVVTNDSSSVQWLPPLSGSSLTQVISQTGTYSCSITSCGITTTASATIVTSNADATVVIQGDTIFCANDSVVLHGPPGMASYLWLPGNVNDSVLVVHQSGTYQLIVFDNASCTDTSLPVTVLVSPVSTTPLLISNSPLCVGDTLRLLTDSINVPYLWSGPNNFQSAVFNPVVYNVQYSDAGVYSVFMSDTLCSGSASVNVQVDEIDRPPVITADTPACLNHDLQLFATGYHFITYNWSGPNGFTSGLQNPVIPSVHYADSGIYYLAISVGTCRANTSIYIDVENCDVIIPNVFTPDEDGLNDVFHLNSDIIKCIEGKIFNRWGTEIFEFTCGTFGWNGMTDKGKRASDGVYYYVLDVTTTRDTLLKFHGYIHLLHGLE